MSNRDPYSDFVGDDVNNNNLLQRGLPFYDAITSAILEQPHCSQ